MYSFKLTCTRCNMTEKLNSVHVETITLGLKCFLDLTYVCNSCLRKFL